MSFDTKRETFPSIYMNTFHEDYTCSLNKTHSRNYIVYLLRQVNNYIGIHILGMSQLLIDPFHRKEPHPENPIQSPPPEINN